MRKGVILGKIPGRGAKSEWVTAGGALVTILLCFTAAIACANEQDSARQEITPRGTVLSSPAATPSLNHATLEHSPTTLATPTASVPPTPTPPPSLAPTPTPALLPVLEPTLQPTATPKPTSTLLPSATPTLTPTPAPIPTATPVPTPGLSPHPLDKPAVVGNAQTFSPVVSDGVDQVRVDISPGGGDLKVLVPELDCSVENHGLTVVGRFFWVRWCQPGPLELKVTHLETGASQSYSLNLVTPTLKPIPTPTPAPTPTRTPTNALEEVFGRLIPDLLEKHEVPGAAIAIVKDGRLVLANGYGLADVENEEPVEPDSLFRIASISKPVTAVAVLRLEEEGKLNLDEKVFDILDRFEAPEGSEPDLRIYDVAVRQLLQHSGGWDRDESYDPMFISRRIERSLGAPKPIGCEDVIRYMLSQPLDFDPGTRYAYSNFGYCILGRIIEEKTGQPYEEYVKSQILQPVGITRMRVGGTLLEDRVEGEVRYYGYPDQSLTHSVLPDTRARVPWHYGGFHFRTMDSHGGWIASPIDLVRFISALDGNKPPPLLELGSVEMMVARPDPPLWVDESHYYGLGFLVRPVGNGANWWHGGSLEGTIGLLVRTDDGMAWAVLFNSRPKAWGELLGEVDRLMWDGVGEVTGWPSHDLFPQYGYD